MMKNFEATSNKVDNQLLSIISDAVEIWVAPALLTKAQAQNIAAQIIKKQLLHDKNAAKRLAKNMVQTGLSGGQKKENKKESPNKQRGEKVKNASKNQNKSSVHNDEIINCEKRSVKASMKKVRNFKTKRHPYKYVPFLAIEFIKEHFGCWIPKQLEKRLDDLDNLHLGFALHISAAMSKLGEEQCAAFDDLYTSVTSSKEFSLIERKSLWQNCKKYQKANRRKEFMVKG